MTANEVSSMVYHSLQQHHNQPGFLTVCNLSLHAENCGGKNKNRFRWRFFSLLVILQDFDKIDLHFLTAGHTKNLSDATFRFMKQKLLQLDVRFPSDMMRVMKESSRLVN